MEAHQGRGVRWPAEGTSLPAPRASALAVMLAAYAHTERAEELVGGALLAGARDPDDREALRLLLGDERRHADILVEASARLGGAPSAPSRLGLGRLGAILRALSFEEAVAAFHLLEIMAVNSYRVLRATNRRDPVVATALGTILRDEAVHLGFHTERLGEVVAAAGPWRRLRLRLLHRLLRRTVVMGRSVVPADVYPAATGLTYDAFLATAVRAYDRAYGGGGVLSVLHPGG